MAEVETRPVQDQSPSTAVALRDAPLQNATSQPPMQGQAKINQMAADAQDNVDAAGRALAGFNAQINNSYAAIEESAKQAGQAKELAVTTAGLARMQAEKATLARANALGTNPGAASFVLDQVAAEYQKNSETAQKYADKVAYAMDPGNLFDNPLKYLKEAILFDFSKEGQASAERAASRSKERYLGLNNMTQEDARTQLAIAQTTTEASVAAEAKVAAHAYNSQALQAGLDKLRSNADNVVRALNLQNAPLEIERARQASENDQARLAIARQQADKQNTLMALQLAREARAEKKMADADRIEQDTVDIVNSGAMLFGIPMKFNSVKELELARKSPEFAAKIDSLYHVGLQARYSRQNPDQTPIVSISSSPFRSLGFIQGMGAQVSPGQQPVVDMLKQVNADFSRRPDVGKMKPAEYAANYDTFVADTASSMYKNIGRGDKNIYAPPPMETFLSNPAFVEGAPTIAAQFKLQNELGKKNIDFNDVSTNLMRSVRSGKMTLDQADSELKFLAAKTIGINNSLRRYNETAGLPNMKNVNVTVEVAHPFYDSMPGGAALNSILPARTQPVDLADDNKRRAYLNKLYSNNIPGVLKQQARTTTMEK